MQNEKMMFVKETANKEEWEIIQEIIAIKQEKKARDARYLELIQELTARFKDGATFVDTEKNLKVNFTPKQLFINKINWDVLKTLPKDVQKSICQTEIRTSNQCVVYDMSRWNKESLDKITDENETNEY